MRVYIGDVATTEAEVIVAPANNRLSGREGVDARIHDVAGPELMKACQEIAAERRKLNLPPCLVGEACVTDAFELRADHVIHVVGPDCRRPSQDEIRRDLLPTAYEALFAEIKRLGAKTVCSPPLSMGVFSYPHREGARMTFEIIMGWLDRDAPDDFERWDLWVKDQNFISNMRTIYREEEDQFPGNHVH